MTIDSTEEKHGAGDLGQGSMPPAVLPASGAAGHVSVIEALAEIPEEEIWLAKQKSKRTRRAYKQDVRQFMRTLKIRSYEELRQADHRAVITWEHIMREVDKAAASTIRRRLAALSSLMKHLTRHGHLSKNHVAEVERPNINREEGTTLASRSSRRAVFSTIPQKTPLKACAIGQSSRWASRWDCGARKLVRWKWEIFTRTVATTRYASSERAAGGMGWLFIPRRHSG
jgi:hypothetical protein